MARECSNTPASSAWRASCQSGATRRTNPGTARLGRRSRTRTARQWAAWRRDFDRQGEDECHGRARVAAALHGPDDSTGTCGFRRAGVVTSESIRIDTAIYPVRAAEGGPAGERGLFLV